MSATVRRQQMHEAAEARRQALLAASDANGEDAAEVIEVHGRNPKKKHGDKLVGPYQRVTCIDSCALVAYQKLAPNTGRFSDTGPFLLLQKHKGSCRWTFDISMKPTNKKGFAHNSCGACCPTKVTEPWMCYDGKDSGYTPDVDLKVYAIPLGFFPSEQPRVCFDTYMRHPPKLKDALVRAKNYVDESQVRKVSPRMEVYLPDGRSFHTHKALKAARGLSDEMLRLMFAYYEELWKRLVAFLEKTFSYFVPALHDQKSVWYRRVEAGEEEEEEVVEAALATAEAAAASAARKVLQRQASSSPTKKKRAAPQSNAGARSWGDAEVYTLVLDLRPHAEGVAEAAVAEDPPVPRRRVRRRLSDEVAAAVAEDPPAAAVVAEDASPVRHRRRRRSGEGASEEERPWAAAAAASVAQRSDVVEGVAVTPEPPPPPPSTPHWDYAQPIIVVDDLDEILPSTPLIKDASLKDLVLEQAEPTAEKPPPAAEKPAPTAEKSEQAAPMECEPATRTETPHREVTRPVAPYIVALDREVAQRGATWVLPDDERQGLFEEVFPPVAGLPSGGSTTERAKVVLRLPVDDERLWRCFVVGEQLRYRSRQMAEEEAEDKEAVSRMLWSAYPIFSSICSAGWVRAVAKAAAWLRRGQVLAELDSLAGSKSRRAKVEKDHSLATSRLSLTDFERELHEWLFPPKVGPPRREQQAARDEQQAARDERAMRPPAVPQVLVADLTPALQGPFRFEALVVSRKTFSTGSGFSAQLQDTKGKKITCNFFREAADAHSSVVKSGNSILLSAKIAKGKGTTIRNRTWGDMGFEVVVGRDAEIVTARDWEPTKPKALLRLPLRGCWPEEVYAVVLRPGELSQSARCVYRIVTLTDESRTTIDWVTFSQQATKVPDELRRGTPVCVKSAHIGDRNGQKQLKNGCVEVLQMTHPRAVELTAWYRGAHA